MKELDADLHGTVGLCDVAQHAGDTAHHIVDGIINLITNLLRTSAKQIHKSAGGSGSGERGAAQRRQQVQTAVNLLLQPPAHSGKNWSGAADAAPLRLKLRIFLPGVFFVLSAHSGVEW